MGKRSDFAKRAKDVYLTPPAAIESLLPMIGHNRTFYEPCAGDGRLVDHLENANQNLQCTGYSDLDPVGAAEWAREEYGKVYRNDVVEKDAFDLTMEDLNGADMIITNPPWTRTKESGYLLHELIRHFTTLAPTWLLFDADWAHTRQAKPLMNRCTHIISIGRVKWIPDSPSTGMDNCAWYGFTHPDLRTLPHPIFLGRDYWKK